MILVDLIHLEGAYVVLLHNNQSNRFNPSGGSRGEDPVEPRDANPLQSSWIPPEALLVTQNPLLLLGLSA